MLLRVFFSDFFEGYIYINYIYIYTVYMYGINQCEALILGWFMKQTIT